jgi:hypothetical protein
MAEGTETIVPGDPAPDATAAPVDCGPTPPSLLAEEGSGSDPTPADGAPPNPSPGSLLGGLGPAEGAKLALSEPVSRPVAERGRAGCPFDPAAGGTTEGTALEPRGASEIPLNGAGAGEMGVKAGMGIAVGGMGALVCEVVPCAC